MKAPRSGFLVFVFIWQCAFAGVLGALGDPISAAILGVSALTTLGYLYLLRITWRLGWIQGRAAFAGAMAEAMRRGMHPIEFLIAEAERDGAVVMVSYEPDE